jgi:hypothetical protein
MARTEDRKSLVIDIGYGDIGSQTIDGQEQQRIEKLPPNINRFPQIAPS